MDTWNCGTAGYVKNVFSSNIIIFMSVHSLQSVCQFSIGSTWINVYIYLHLQTTPNLAS